MNEIGLVMVGAAVAFLPNLVLQVLNNKHQLNLERLKLRDEGRRRAYKRAFALARQIRNTCYPLADEKQRNFKAAMKKYLTERPERDYVYFSSPVMKLFDEIEGTYVCMTEPDLVMDTDWQEFVDHKLCDKASALEKAIRAEMTP